MGIAFENDMSAPATVTPVGATIGSVFITMKVNGSFSAMTAAEAYFYVVNKIRFGHGREKLVNDRWRSEAPVIIYFFAYARL